MSSNPSQLFLLADHIKLSLLERQRAISLNLEPNSHDGQISRSLDSLQSGIQALEAQAAEDTALQSQLTQLKSQYTELSSQFTGSSSTTPSATISSPNNPSLDADFRAAQQTPTSSTKRTPKSVRFTDNPSAEETANREQLFPYRDNPDDDGPPDQSNLDNQQIHTYHSQVLAEQDEQLDRLGDSIRNQRELSIQIGDELDGQALLLDDVSEGADRHLGQLDGAKRRVDRFARKARENWSMTIIAILVIVLILLIIILK